RVCRHRHRCAGAGCDHVDRDGQHVHPEYLPGVLQPAMHRRAGKPDGEDRLPGDQGRGISLHLLPAAEIRAMATIAGRHLDHPDTAFGHARPVHALPQRLGAADRLDHRVRGRTWMVIANNFSPIYPLHLPGVTFPCYIAVIAVVLNIVVTVVLSLILNAVASDKASDVTTAADYI